MSSRGAVDDVFNFFKRELGERPVSSRRAIDALRRVRYVAAAMGPDATRNDLLPALQETNETPDDEYLFVLAEQYAELRHYVGGEAHYPLLVPPLEVLCSIEENLVRKQAVEGLTLLLADGTEAQRRQLAEETMVPTLQRLVKGSFMSRIAAAGLSAPTLSNVSPKQRQHVIKLFNTLCLERDAPMVQRAAAASLEGYFTALTSEEFMSGETGTTKALERCWSSESDVVRASVLKATVSLATLLGAAEFTETALPVIQAGAADKAWSVRRTFANVLGALARSPLKPDLLQPLLEQPIASLVFDPEQEVRHATVLALVQCVEKMNPTALGALIDTLPTVCQDRAAPVRTACTQLLLPLARSIWATADSSTDKVKSLLSFLFPLVEDDVFDVKFSAVSQCAELCQTGLGRDATAFASIVTLMEKCIKDPRQWRIRLAVVKQLPLLIEQGNSYSTEKVSTSTLMPLLLSALSDPVHAVRTGAIEGLEKLASSGPEDLEAQVVLPKLLSQLEAAKTPTSRITLLHAACRQVRNVPHETFSGQVLPVFLHALQHPIPNVKFAAARDLAWIGRNVEGAVAGNGPAIKAALQPLQSDEDLDVQYFAEEALQVFT
eukprot:GHVU01038238.1.p1 GENE.GHVU01038238.1~~GHVU01038238.1.p1  ORF type:complete len:607 (+),score=123.50 GHVU01038238.1:302-2122(+)